MSNPPPTPARNVPDDIAEKLTDQSPDVLRNIARYADELAEHREREARLAEQDERDEDVEGEPTDLPDDVPDKATIKEINDNHYYYWQWREGDRVKSKYKSPVNPDE